MLRSGEQDINSVEFSSVLAACRLLKADFPTKDERWSRFYSKFIVIDHTDERYEEEGPQHKRYSLLPTQIALFFLAQGTPEEKAQAICNLFRDASDRAKDKKLTEEELRQVYSEIWLSTDQLKCIVSIFVNIALVLLPMYASDYPLKDRRQYYMFLV